MAHEPSCLALDDAERRVLEQVERQRGRANWHSVAVLIGPTRESTVTLLRVLARRCLAREAGERGAFTRYAITALGRVALHGRAAVSTDAGALLADTLAAGPMAMLELFRGLLDDPVAFAAALANLLDARPDERRAVALGLDYLPRDARLPLAERLADDPALLLDRWCPPRLNFAGEHPPMLPQPAWDALLARGLAHPAPATRGHAASLIFATARGARFAAELLALLPDGDSATILALGGATDAASGAALEALLDSPDVARAASAARALAERPDGEAGFARALADPRDDVRGAARYAAAMRSRTR